MRNLQTENIRMAWQALIGNKMRALLTMLGIIIGVASVIALVSIGYGVQQDIRTSISQLGSNLLIVMPGAPRTPGVRPAAGSMQSLTYKDYQAVAELPHIEDAMPSIQSSYVVVYGNKNWTTSVRGVTAAYESVRNTKVVEGRYWTPKEYQTRDRVAVISQRVKKELFGDISPIGQKIRIHNDPFTVIGLLEEKGSDYDNLILVPFTTAQERLLGVTYLHGIMLNVDKAENMDMVQANITNLLRVRHGIREEGHDDFNIENMADVLDAIQQATGTLTLFLAAVAAISLLVGGIGIMNIMLVSVTERTKEIGIRKALGATYRMIITQFLVEAVAMSLAGGLIGIVCGIGVAKALSALTGISTEVTLLPVIGSFAFSMLIGLIFGLYPARKAAKLNPIDALHYE